MKRAKSLAMCFGLLAASWGGVGTAKAAEMYTQRLTVSTGVEWSATLSAAFVLGAEYEYRFQPMFGVGGLAEYRFSTPGLLRLGIPFFFHPLEGDWIILAAPLLEFSNGQTNGGARLGTRVPIPLGAISLIPSFAVDFIGGTQNYIIGIGIEL